MRNYKTGILIAGDSTGAVKSIKLTRAELQKLNGFQEKGAKRTSGYTKTLRTQNGVLQTYTRSIKNTVVAFASLTAIGGGVRTLASFSQEISTLGAVTGTTGAVLKSLSDETKRLGATTRFSATQAAEGATFLARAGFDAQEVLLSLESTLLLAQAGSLGLAEAADIASNVLKGFQKEAEETGRVVDVLALAANSSNTTVTQLGNALSFVAPIAQAAGVSLETSAAAIGALSDAGIQSERAGTGLRAILIELESAGGDLSVTSRGLVPVLETLASRNLSLADAADLVGKRQAASLLVLLQSIPQIQKLDTAYNSAAGAAKAAADAMDDNLNGALLAAKSGLEAVVLSLGDLGVTETLKDGFNGLADGLRFVAANGETVGEVFEVLSIAGAGLATLYVARLAPSVQLYATAQGVSTLATLRNIKVQASHVTWSYRQAAAQVALTTATKASTAALALVGGPLGVATLAVAGFVALALNADSARVDIAGLTTEVDNLTESLDRMSIKQRAVAKVKLVSNLDETASDLKTTTSELEFLVQRRNELLESVTSAEADGRDSGAFFGAQKEQLQDLNDEITITVGRIEELENVQSKLQGSLKDVNVSLLSEAGGLAEFESKLKDSVKATERQNAVMVEFEKRFQALDSLRGIESPELIKAAQVELSKEYAETIESIDTKELVDSVNSGEAAVTSLTASQQSLIDKLFPLQAAQREYKEQVAELTLAESHNLISKTELLEGTAQLATTLREAGEAASVSGHGLDTLSSAQATLLDQLNPIAAAAAELETKLALLRDAYGTNAENAVALAEAEAKVRLEYESTVDSINRNAQTLVDSFLPVDAALREQQASIDLLNTALARGLVTEEQYAAIKGKLAASLKETSAAATFAAHGLTNLTASQKSLLESILPTNSAADKLATLMAELDAIYGDSEENAKALADAQDALSKAFDSATGEVEDQTKALAKNKSERDKLVDSLLPLKKQTREYAESVELLNKAQAEGEISATEFSAAILSLKDSNEALFPEIARQKEATEEIAQAWVAASERIDGVFADMWQGGIDSFDDFSDQLKGAFKKLLAELAHFAITRPILVSLGLSGTGGAAASTGGAATQLLNGFLGGGSAGSGASTQAGTAVGGAIQNVANGGQSSGGFSSLGSGLTRGLGTLGAVSRAGIQGVTQFGLAAGASPTGGFVTGVQSIGANTQALGSNLSGGSLSGNASLGLGVLTTAAAGVVGSYVGNAIGESVFNKTAENNYGSIAGSIGGAAVGAATLGATYGSAAGPIGAAVGAVVGALIDVAAGGDGKKRTNTGALVGPSFAGQPAAITAASGQTIQAYQRRGDREAAVSFRDTLLTIDEGLTTLARNAGIAVDFSNTVFAGGFSPDAGYDEAGAFFGVKGFNGPDGTNSLSEAAAAYVLGFIDQIEDELPSRVRTLLPQIEKDAAKLVSVFESALNIDALLELDVVGDTREAVAALNTEQLTLLENYNNLTDVVIDSSASLSTGAEEFANLNVALGEQKNAALALTLAYEAAGEQIAGTFETTIQSIQESLLSEEELYAKRRADIATLTAELNTIEDPERAAEISREIDGLSRSAFGLLDESQQQALGNEFIEFLSEAQAVAQRQVDAGLAELQSRETAVRNTIDLEISSLGTQAAETQAAAAATQAAAAQAQVEAVERFTSSVNGLEDYLEQFYGSNGAFNFAGLGAEVNA